MRWLGFSGDPAWSTERAVRELGQSSVNTNVALTTNSAIPTLSAYPRRSQLTDIYSARHHKTECRACHEYEGPFSDLFLTFSGISAH